MVSSLRAAGVICFVAGMSLAKAIRRQTITRIDGALAAESRDDAVAIEEPLELRVGGRSVVVLMRTPGHDRELAAGFLVTEGLVRHRDDILDLVRCAGRDAVSAPEENVLDVLLAPGVAVDFSRLSRHVFASSSCGLCSKAGIEALRTQFPPIVQRFTPSRHVLASLPEKLRATQAAFAATGGLHACALFDRAGGPVVVREDVGRHNALDKVIGHALFAERLPLSDAILLVSGRVSFEIVQKALAAGLACIAAISAPTSAAVAFAAGNGQTLVGFLRGPTMNVYSGTLAD
jgi:FdhD protein